MIKNILTLTILGFISGLLLYFTHELINNVKEDTKRNEENEVVEDDNKIDDSVIILNTEEASNGTVYTAKKYGYISDIVLDITISNNEVINIEVVEQAESYFKKVENVDFLNTLKTNYNNLDTIDVVSGATYTSNTLIDIVNVVLKTHMEAN